MARQIHPHPVVHPIYDHAWSEYPDRVRIAMDNGHTVLYQRIIDQPEPVLAPQVEQFTRTCFGGEKYKTKGLGKRMGRRHPENGGDEEKCF